MGLHNGLVIASETALETLKVWKTYYPPQSSFPVAIAAGLIGLILGFVAGLCCSRHLVFEFRLRTGGASEKIRLPSPLRSYSPKKSE